MDPKLAGHEKNKIEDGFIHFIKMFFDLIGKQNQDPADDEMFLALVKILIGDEIDAVANQSDELPDIIARYNSSSLTADDKNKINDFLQKTDDLLLLYLKILELNAKADPSILQNLTPELKNNICDDLKTDPKFSGLQSLKQQLC